MIETQLMKYVNEVFFNLIKTLCESSIANSTFNGENNQNQDKDVHSYDLHLPMS